MELILPDDKKILLDEKLPHEEKKAIVDKILSEYGEHFSTYWKSPRTRVCLDIMSNYLSKEKKGKKAEEENV